MKKYPRFFLLPLFLGLIALACERPVVTVSEGELAFSSDTVKFDSIFVNFLTPSERLIVTNNTNNNIRISRVWLESEENSEFNMIVDGIPGNDVSDIVLRQEDSLIVFINLNSELRDNFTEEYIAFQVGDNVQRVLLRAFILDAYLLRARFRNDTISGFFFRRDTVLTPDKPIVIDGPVIIPEGIRVDVMPGTEIFFTPYKFRANQQAVPPDTFIFFSQLFVNGTLHAEGTPDDPVIFQGSRLDNDFQEIPAQWRGMQFSTSSRDNVLKHCIVKNAQFGVRVDSSSLNTNPKLTIQQSEIRNMSAYGVWGVGFTPDVQNAPIILMENSIVNTCKERTVFIWGGGRHEFYNSTFANYNLRNFSRRTPQIWITNFGDFPPQRLVGPTNVLFTNCAIWGSEEDEITLEQETGAPFDLSFQHCLLRYSDELAEEIPIAGFLTQSLVNQDPLFNAPNTTRDYRPQAGSPLIDAGLDLSQRFEIDVRGRFDSLRSLPFDIGAFEFYPIEE